jgi:signal transduction histidine kinase
MGDNIPVKALYYLDSTFQATPDRGIADWWRKYNTCVNYYTYYDHNDKKLNQYIDSMFLLLKGKENQYGFEYAHTLFAKGGALQGQKQYSQAFQYYFDGRTFARLHLDSCNLSDFSNCLGLICYHQGQYLKAVPYLRQAYEEAISCRSDASFAYGFILPQGILNTTAICFEQANLLDSALNCYQKASDFINERAHRYPQKQAFINTALGVVEGNLGGTCAILKRYKEAEMHLKNSIRINDRPGYAIEDAQTVKIKLADLYSHLGRLPEADTLLQQVFSDLSSGRGKGDDNEEVWRSYYYLKWKISDQVKNYPEAYHYSQRYYTYIDSVDKVNAGLKYADLDVTSHDHEQQFQLTLLKKNDEVKTAYLIAVIVFLILAICIVFLVWNHLRRSKKNIHQLTFLNKQLRDTLSALKQSQADNNRMMKIAAHDLRNPISGMMSVAALMMKESHVIEKDRKLLQMIKTAGENSLSLVNDLLQVNTQVKEQEKEPVNLQDLLLYCIGLLKHKAESKKQKIELKATPVTLRLSNEKMWRVISNLIGNAIKFSPPGGLITISLEQHPEDVLITIKDHGIGIPEDLKEKIFDIFTDARRRGTGGEESFGLGLAVSKQIVEAHGGKIWFESEPGRGTTFFVSFKAA